MPPRRAHWALVLAGLLPAGPAPAQPVTVLHSFAGGAGDGAIAPGSLTASGSTLYGMTQAGGSIDFGTAFRINTDGTGFGLLHAFVSGASDGRNPNGSLIQSGPTLYGMTQF